MKNQTKNAKTSESGKCCKNQQSQKANRANGQSRNPENCK